VGIGSLKDVLRAGLSPFSFRVALPVQGRFVHIPIRHGVGLEVVRAYTRKHYRWMSILLENLPLLRNSCFVDVGAHLGESLIAIKRLDRNWPYLGFEPNPLCVDYVQELVRVNGYPACALISAGLSDAAGETNLYLESPRDSGATIISDLRPGRAPAETTVRISVFDQIRENLAPSAPVGFIKIDVEGAELKALTGMTKTLASDRPLVLCEVLWADPRADIETSTERNKKLVTLLKGLDYEIYQVLKHRGGNPAPTLRHISGFEAQVWSSSNEHLCDYLFAPAEMVATATKDGPPSLKRA